MAFLAYLAMFYAPLATLSQFTTWFTNFLTGCQRVFELLDTPVETTDPKNPIEFPPLQSGTPRGSAMGVDGIMDDEASGQPRPSRTQSVPPIAGSGRAIRFEDVTFGYESHQPVLKEVNFEIKPGETVGIVGRSGSGKTTLVNLLCRFYDVGEGRVTVDGVDVRRLTSHQLRRDIGVVLQEPFMFRGTIWQNLIYGLPGATPEQAVAAAKAAQAHEFVLNSPLGYDTWLGERGAGLSGGERQRLSIARAILYDPPILVLDEATSNVDVESEQAIQQALRALTRGRTTIAIAHRLSTLREADRILVFDRGRLIEQGTHTQLLTTDGQYARMVKLQSHVSREQSVDAVLEHAEEHSQTSELNGHASAEPAADAFLPIWLTPADATIRSAKSGAMEVELHVAAFLRNADDCEFRRNSPSYRGVFAVNLFPATNPNDYISLRLWNRDGSEQEIGILRQLDQWPAEAQSLVRRALERRYYLQTITGIDQIKLELGHLALAVRTTGGPRRFTMRWSQNQVQDFGERGKVLLDLDDNRFLVPDVEALPPRERDLFQRYVYW
jgi:ABC-type multidrug transport system ATPase subunit